MSLLLTYCPADAGCVGLAAQDLLAVAGALEGQVGMGLEHDRVLPRDVVW